MWLGNLLVHVENWFSVVNISHDLYHVTWPSIMWRKFSRWMLCAYYLIIIHVLCVDDKTVMCWLGAVYMMRHSLLFYYSLLSALEYHVIHATEGNIVRQMHIFHLRKLLTIFIINFTIGKDVNFYMNITTQTNIATFL